MAKTKDKVKLTTTEVRTRIQLGVGKTKGMQKPDLTGFSKIFNDFTRSFAQSKLASVANAIKTRFRAYKDAVPLLMEQFNVTPEGSRQEWDSTYASPHAGGGKGTTLSVKDTYVQSIQRGIQQAAASIHYTGKHRWGSHIMDRIAINWSFVDQRKMSTINPHWIYFEYGGVVGKTKEGAFGRIYHPKLDIGSIVRNSRGETKTVAQFVFMKNAPGTRHTDKGMMLPLYNWRMKSYTNSEGKTTYGKRYTLADQIKKYQERFQGTAWPAKRGATGFQLIQPYHILTKMFNLYSQKFKDEMTSMKKMGVIL